jgi:enoyl-CoA hydratase/carnithine racemase
MHSRIYKAFEDVRHDNDIWVVVVTGVGRAFSAGHDLTEVGHDPDREDLNNMVRETWKPTIAAINGFALAQGAGIALNCDIRIAADTAQIGYPQAKLGRPGMTGQAVLAHLVPMNIALELIYTAEPITAQRAYELQLVNKVVPADKLKEATDSMVQRILSSAPLPLQIMKEAAVLGQKLNFRERRRITQIMNDTLRASEDAREGLAARRERRQPVWKGR